MSAKFSDWSKFDLNSKTALITGGGGLLGPEHAAGLAKCGANIVLVDIEESSLKQARNRVLAQVSDANVVTKVIDITDELALQRLYKNLLDVGIEINILVNNAAVNPKMMENDSGYSGRVEDYDMNEWNREISVGITGTFLCCKVFGSAMAKRTSGVIINVASDLAIQAPDQRVYSSTGNIEDVKNFKPIGYPVVKASMLGLNRYLATYWAHKGVRVNCLIPGAVYNFQSDSLVKNVIQRIPLARWANRDEYQGAIAFMASDASSYMTGQELVMDGGRCVW